MATIGYFVNNLNKWHLLAIISNNWQQLFIVLQQMPTIGILWQHMFGKFWQEMSSFWQQLFHFRQMPILCKMAAYEMSFNQLVPAILIDLC